MPDRKFRPLTADEKAILGHYTKPYGAHLFISFLFGVFISTATVFIVLFSAWKWIGPHIGFPDARHQSGLFLFLSFVIACGFLLRNARGMKKRTDNPLALQIKEDLLAGNAEVEDFKVAAAAELREFEDEGAGFFLDLGGRVLFVQGQDIYDYAHDAEDEDGKAMPKVFPAGVVRYSSAPKSGLRLGIEPAGPYLAPRLVGPFDYRKNAEIPTDGTFYDGTLEEVLAKLGLKQA